MTCEHGEPRGQKYCPLCRRAGFVARDEAVTAVSVNSDGTWWAACVRAIKHLAKTNDTFTADDVLEIVDKAGYTTNDNRAMGGVMRECQAKGLIKPTDNFVPSTNKRKHASPTRVWASCIATPQRELF